MANTNLTPLTPETQELLNRFSTHLYARSGMKDSTIALVLGYIRRMIPELGTEPTEQALDEYIATLRRKKVNYGNLTNCIALREVLVIVHFRILFFAHYR